MQEPCLNCGHLKLRDHVPSFLDHFSSEPGLRSQHKAALRAMSDEIVGHVPARWRVLRWRRYRELLRRSERAERTFWNGIESQHNARKEGK